MEDFLSAHAFDCVVDATHPYAVEVTQNIQSACTNKSVPYLRLLKTACLYPIRRNVFLT